MTYSLPPKIPQHLLRIQAECRSQGYTLYDEILENSHVHVIEGVHEFSNIEYHDVILYLPSEIMNKIPIKRNKEVRDNLLGMLQESTQELYGEAINSLALDFIDANDENFRNSHRLTKSATSGENPMLATASSADEDRIWKGGPLRAFISHKHTDKIIAGKLKEQLATYGISSFVAHEDLPVTTAWQKDIEIALRTMHVMLPLLTQKFRCSEWTDQEVGVALGRGVLVIPIVVEQNPHGFIEQYQAMLVKGKKFRDVAHEIFDVTFKNQITEENAKEAFIHAVAASESFDQSNRLAGFLPHVSSLSESQIFRICEAYRHNNQVHESYHFNGKYSEGLVDCLLRVTGNPYEEDAEHCITLKNDDGDEATNDDVPF